jgi:hypothetical protein
MVRLAAGEHAPEAAPPPGKPALESGRRRYGDSRLGDDQSGGQKQQAKNRNFISDPFVR